MQRTLEQLREMSHEELIGRILEAQELLQEGLAVRDSLHGVLNDLLKAKADEVEYYAALSPEQLDEEGLELKKAYAAARHAVSNPYGLMLSLKEKALQQLQTGEKASGKAQGDCKVIL